MLDEIEELLDENIESLVNSAFFIIGALGAYALYRWLFAESLPAIKEYITNEIWQSEMWRAEGESYIRNGLWYAYVKNPSYIYGSALISQGVHAHQWVTFPPLRKEVTIYRDEPSPILIVEFIGKRTMPIKKYSIGNTAWNSVGMCLWGDVGLDYDSSDTTKPHALVIDFYFDAPTFLLGFYFSQGSNTIDNDYRSGLKIGSMPNINQDYHFRARIDTWIQRTLEHYNLPYFTIKLVQFYIEVKGSEGSIEVKKFDVGLA